MKKHLIITLAVVSTPFSALAAIGIPGVTAGTTPPEFIGQIYKFALLISGVLALGAIVYGGAKYMMAAGNPSGQSEGKEWVRGAILGLLLLFGAYMILNFINPQITTLTLPSLAPIPISTGGGGGGGGSITGGGAVGSLTLTSDQVISQFQAAGIGFVSGIQLAGLRQSTVDELIRLNSTCKLANVNCDLTVTSATGGVHEPGACSHSNGYKVDLRSGGSGTALSNFITQNYQPSPIKRSDGATIYRAPSGALYADERNLAGVAPHWDVVTGC